MNISLICRRYFPCIGGIETSIYELSKAFSKCGHKVTIITASEKPQNKRKEFAEILYIPHINQALFWMPLIYAKLLERRAIEVFSQIKEVPDVIICRDSLLTCAACRCYSDVPVIYIPSMDVKVFAKTIKKTPKKSSMKEFIYSLMNLGAYRVEIKKQEEALYGATHNIVFCESMRKQLRKSYNKSKYAIEVCYPGSAIDGVTPEVKKQSERTRLLFVGRISPEKNLTMLLKALSYIREEVELTIVGDGLKISDLKKEADKLSSNIRVNFAGYRTDVVNYYMDADFLILPSIYESFGQVIIESFTCGVPVIGFATMKGITNTAVEELVTEYETGLVCREFTVEALALCIEQAIELKKDKEKKGRMDFRCMEYVQKHCNWNHLANRCLLCKKEEMQIC